AASSNGTCGLMTHLTYPQLCALPAHPVTSPLRSSLSVLPRLSWQIGWRGQRAQIGDERPDAFGAEHRAKSRHAPWTTIVDGAEHLGIGTPIVPTPISKVRTDPSRAVARVATVAIHGGKKQRAAACHRAVAMVRIAQRATRGRRVAGHHVCFVRYGRRH